MPRWVAVAVVAAIAVAGLAGYLVLRPSGRAAASNAPTVDDPLTASEDLAGTSTASASSESSASSSSSDAGTRTAGSVLLVPDDLPAGWDSRSTAVTGVDPLTCGFDLGDTSKITGNAVRMFVPRDGSGLNVISVGAVTTTDAVASDVVAQIANGTAEACIRDALVKDFSASGAAIDGVTMSAGALRDGASITIRYTVSRGDQSMALFQEEIAFAKENRFAIVSLTSAGAPFPQHLHDQLVTSAETRLG